jgi:transposase
VRLQYVARYRELFFVTAEQSEELMRWSQSRTLPAGDVFRARLILALADGKTYATVQRELQTTARTISRWKQRFKESGIEGLEAKHKGSKPRTATPPVQAKLCRKVQQRPQDGSTHWSVRKLAGEMGVSKSSVHRILTQARLQPHRLERYMASNDPEFENKAADIIGLYLEPPQHAAVFCVDEKTAIQALDRLDPVLPLSPGRAERHGFEYYRHGTLSLYAALDVKTNATPATSSSVSSRTWSSGLAGPKRFISCSIISPHTRPKPFNSFWPTIPKSASTSRQPIPHGSTRWSCGLPRSSVISSLVAFFPPSLT